MQTTTRTSYALVLGAALLCYAALGAVLRLLPELVHGSFPLGLAVGAPAMTAVATRPLGGRRADRRGPVPVLIAGALVMALATVPMVWLSSLAALIASRLAVGAGEGLMMSAGVLWLLRLAGPERRGRALAHIGLANYGGLTVGPLLTEAIGVAHPSRVFAVAAVLPLAAAIAVRFLPEPRPEDGEQRPLGEVMRMTARPGAGLMLVNFGYVALLSFGTSVVAGHGLAGAGLVIPTFAAGVIAVRILAASVPDRAGARRTLRASTTVAAAGLVLVAVAPTTLAVLGGVAALAAGQALAVPALGLLAIARVPPADHGAAAGAFFAWFDAGVGLGGLGAGAVAHATSPAGALIAAAGAVASVPLVANGARR